MKNTPYQYLKLDSIMTFRIKKELVPNLDSFFKYMSDRIFKDYEVEEIDGDTDIMRRIYVYTTDGHFTIRTWNIKETNKSIVVDFSIYEDNEFKEEA